MDDQAKAAFDLVATNVAVITVTDDEGVHGCTANAWAEAADPPVLLITLRRGSTTRARIVDAGRFAVNLLAEDQGELARTFARPGDRFAGVAHRSGPELGQPLLPQSLASFECDLEAEYEFGSYDILTGTVRSVATRDSARPLLFFDRGFRSLTEGKR
jgi:3-hydroxy-9,10-secoandrosta-1,3,5(10)-triene-9,17-dione monooxygenase reductase component